MSIIRVSTQNIKSFPTVLGRKKLKKCVNKALKNSDIVNWQEIHPDFYKKWIYYGRRHKKKKVRVNWRHVRANGTPITWRKQMFTVIERRKSILHKKVIGVCNRRIMTTTVLTVRETGQMIININVHFVPGAHATGYKFRKAARVAAYNTGIKAIENEVMLLRHRFKSYNPKFLINGDMNWNKIKFAGFKDAFPNSIDKVFFEEGELKLRNKTIKSSFSDHALRTAVLEIV